MSSRSKINGGGSIPLASKKMIQSLKEIVNCPETEIYATLKDCNMDPNEAVNRLLSQDPFHEVKSKREKKKENKDVHDSRSRASISSTSRGGRGGADRYTSHASIPQFGFPDSSASRGKPTHNKDSGITFHTNSTTSLVGNNISKVQPSFSDAATERAFPTNTAENFPAALPSSSFQSPWGGTVGQVSMADIVKMGRSHGKTSSTFNSSQQLVNNQHAIESALRLQSNDLHSSHNHAFNVSEMNKQSQVNEGYHVALDDDWTLHEEPPAGSGPSFVEPTVGSELGDDVYDRTKEQFRSRGDELRFVEEDTSGNTHAIQSVPGSNQGVQEENSSSASGVDNNLYQNANSIKVHHGEDEEAGMSVSSVTANLQSISLPKEDDSASEEDGPAVKIPDHLQVQSSECSHLSFGTFGSAANGPFSGSFDSRPVENNDLEAPMATGALLAGNAESRNAEYYDDEHLNTASDENTAHRMGNDSGNFDTPSVSQPDVLKEEAPEVTHENQYSFPSSTANYSFENQKQLNASFEQQMSSQMHGLPSFSGVTPYSNSLPGTLLASNVLQSLREAEIAYSPFPISQSMPAKYNNSASPINGPAASIAEAMKTGNFSAAQQTQNLPGGSISGGLALPQQLLHPYSQPSVPMGHYASMLGYPFMPQSYPYLPSAFQQAFAAGNSNFPQSLAAAMLPQYKNSVSVNSLPQSAAVASGYGAAFGNSNSMPSNFPMNHSATPSPAGTSMSYDDVLSSQYKDASHLLSLQQAQGSRTMSGVPGSAYYSFQGQTQQASQQPQQGGFRQTQQQPSHQQHYTPSLSGYPNFYHHFQAGPTLDQQLQMSSRDGSQGQQQQKQTQQQLWQNGY